MHRTFLHILEDWLAWGYFLQIGELCTYTIVTVLHSYCTGGLIRRMVIFIQWKRSLEVSYPQKAEHHVMCALQVVLGFNALVSYCLYHSLPTAVLGKRSKMKRAVNMSAFISTFEMPRAEHDEFGEANSPVEQVWNFSQNMPFAKYAIHQNHKTWQWPAHQLHISEIQHHLAISCQNVQILLLLSHA